MQAQDQPIPIPPESIIGQLIGIATTKPSRTYCCTPDGDVSLGELLAMVMSFTATLADSGVTCGSRVMVALENSVEHVAAIFALCALDAVWVPVNIHLVGAPLAHLFDDCHPEYLVVRPHSAIATAVTAAVPSFRSRGERRIGLGADDPVVVPGPRGAATPSPLPADVRAVMYTSRATGPAKGVLVTETMLWASAVGCLAVAEPTDGDTFYLWEPMYHIGGAQVLLLPLLTNVQLAPAPSFSASRFWLDVAATGATHLHYLGGILQILLAEPPSPAERSHALRIAWGAGADPDTWREAERRFGIEIRECYGMTETSSIVTVNRSNPDGGIGAALPWFDLRLDPIDNGDLGEMLVRPKRPDLITSGYLNHVNVSRSPRTGWWQTGDLGTTNGAGQIRFAGRMTDSIRRRGENVSAYEVESVFAQHPDVALCAAVGVDTAIGDQDIKLFVVPADGRHIDPHALLHWSATRLAGFQRPSYISVVANLPTTPSRRVIKHRLPKEAADTVYVDLPSDQS